MSHKAVTVFATFIGDGATTVFSFDLLSDPYGFLNHGTVENWFATSKKSANPIAVISESPSMYTASLSGTVITATFQIAPNAGFVYIGPSVVFA